MEMIMALMGSTWFLLQLGGLLLLILIGAAISHSRKKKSNVQVTTELRGAKLPERFMAFAIDSGVIWNVWCICVQMYFARQGLVYGWMRGPVGLRVVPYRMVRYVMEKPYSAIRSTEVHMCIMLLIVWAFLYFFFSESRKRTASFGKRMVGLCIVRKDGHKAGIIDIFMRTVVKIFPVLLCAFTFLPVVWIGAGIIWLVYIFIMLFHGNHRAAYDLISDCMVVRKEHIEAKSLKNAPETENELPREVDGAGHSKITNFAHMANYKDICSKLLWIENQMVNGYMEAACETEEEYTMRIESCRAVAGVARTALEMMIDELFYVGKITDAKAEEILQMISTQEQSYRVNLYGKIKLMEEYKLVSSEMIKDMHFVRMVGNQEIHATQAKECYVSEKENAKKVYEALYRISYLFANQYMAEFAQLGREVEAAQGNAVQNNEESEAPMNATSASRSDAENVQTNTTSQQYMEPENEKKESELKAGLIAIVAAVSGLAAIAFICDCWGEIVYEIPFVIFMVIFFGGWMFITTVIISVLSFLFRG